MIDTKSKGGSIYKASGKVLLAGGYGVLEEGNFGLSLAINKHFFSRTCLHQSASQENVILVEVKSPQIRGHWIYHYDSDV
jgi:phosphomevalonate kinase